MMGKRWGMVRARWAKNRAARRQHERDYTRAMELMLDARWNGKYFVKEEGMFSGWTLTYYDRNGNQIPNTKAI